MTVIISTEPHSPKIVAIPDVALRPRGPHSVSHPHDIKLEDPIPESPATPEPDPLDHEKLIGWWPQHYESAGPIKSNYVKGRGAGTSRPKQWQPAKRIDSAVDDADDNMDAATGSDSLFAEDTLAQNAGLTWAIESEDMALDSTIEAVDAAQDVWTPSDLALL